MSNIKILWVDDEIDLLKPHIIFLQNKGYEVDTANSGTDAIDIVKENFFDIIFLDENMPGLSGIETLNEIKKIAPLIPVVMITKSEEENIMEDAIGANIADYLIKPVKPNQVVLSIKKHVHKSEIVSEKTSSAYQSNFQKIAMDISMASAYNDWVEVHKKLVYWEMELDKSGTKVMDEVFQMQKSQANADFGKFIKSNYIDWFSGTGDKPTLSPNIFKEYVLPQLSKGQSTVFLLIDNLRYDQWKTILPRIRPFYNLEREDLYYSILPTATQYSRNAIFAGLMPLEIEQKFPHLWLNDEDEGGKNQHEPELLKSQLEREGFKSNFYFEKIFNNKQGQKLVDNYKNILNHSLSVLVFNFVDILSHARTDSKMIRELAQDESAYRSLTLSWFEHSPLLELLEVLSKENVKIVITTDHGTVKVKNPKKVIGDKKTSTNLRYKMGKNLDYNRKDVFEIRKPQEAHLPVSNLTSSYIFAVSDDFLAYPNNYNYYVNYYKNTFQHGGVSLDEMILPAITLVPRK